MVGGYTAPSTNHPPFHGVPSSVGRRGVCRGGLNPPRGSQQATTTTTTTTTVDPPPNPTNLSLTAAADKTDEYNRSMQQAMVGAA